MAEYDLTNLVAPFLDRHLVFPLLEFLSSKNIYPENDLLQGKIELLSATNMVDFQIDIYKKLHNVEETPIEMEARREKVVKELSTLQEKVKPLIEFLSNEALIHQLRQEKLYTPTYLKEKHSITADQIDTLYKFAKFQFDCGNYSGAMNCLTHYLPLSVGTNGERTRRYFSALWGKFSAEILLLNWEAALKDMDELKQLIESGSFGTPVEQLQQRAWLIHWSLFIYFHYPEASSGLIDLCFYPHYLSTIQNICPHILRYLTAVVIINHTNNSGNKFRKNAVKELVKVLQQEQNSYKDPIIEFLECLFVHFDFEGAQNKLRECEKVLLHDFFLVGCKDDFIENARFFIFETYCRIHQCIDIKMLAEKLNMENDQAEKWIVDLIRNARLDAKIDSAQGHIIMGSHNPTVYEQILEKTRDLYYKTQSIASTLTQDA